MCRACPICIRAVCTVRVGRYGATLPRPEPPHVWPGRPGLLPTERARAGPPQRPQGRQLVVSLQVRGLLPGVRSPSCCARAGQQQRSARRTAGVAMLLHACCLPGRSLPCARRGQPHASSPSQPSRAPAVAQRFKQCFPPGHHKLHGVAAWGSQQMPSAREPPAHGASLAPAPTATRATPLRSPCSGSGGLGSLPRPAHLGGFSDEAEGEDGGWTELGGGNAGIGDGEGARGFGAPVTHGRRIATSITCLLALLPPEAAAL